MSCSGLVSIIIPTFNRAHTLPRAINSVLSQSYTNWELIIVDNFSQDNTISIMSAFTDSRIKFYQTINDGSAPASTRNYGISKANGDFIAFLDSDDWWTNNKLEIGVSYLQRGYDFIYTDYILVNSVTKSSRKIIQWNLVSPIFDDLLDYGCPIACSSVIVRSDLIYSISGFSQQPELVSVEDFDAWLRISKLTNKFVRIPSADTFYNFSGENLSASSSLSLKCLDKLKRAYFSEVKTSRFLPLWLNYGFSISHFKTGNYFFALRYAFSTFISSFYAKTRLSRLEIIFKSMYIILASLYYLAIAHFLS